MIARVRAELEPVAQGPILAGAAGLNLEEAESAEQLIGRAIDALSNTS
jgi:hypothetical protein